MVVVSLVMTTRSAVPRFATLDVLELEAQIFHDGGFAPVRVAMSPSMALRRSPKPGRLHRGGHERLAQRVDHERGQRVALDVLGDDEERLASPRRPSRAAEAGPSWPRSSSRAGGSAGPRARTPCGPDRSRSTARGSRGRTACLPPRRSVGVHALGLFDRDHAVLADLVHALGDDLADLGVAVGRDGRDLGDLRVVRGLLGLDLEVLGDRGDRPCRCPS